MGFVNEKIPETEKDRLPFKVDTSPNGYKPTLWKWTIDRDRGACVVHSSSFGGGYDGTQKTEIYVMIWRDNLVRFAGDPTFSADRKTMNWNVHELVIPECLTEEEGEVRKLIREALDTIGFLYNRDFLDNVNVEFVASATVTNASS
jgi:hypothetical protein